LSQTSLNCNFTPHIIWHDAQQIFTLTLTLLSCLLFRNGARFEGHFPSSRQTDLGVIRIEGKMLHLHRGARPGPGGRFRASLMKTQRSPNTWVRAFKISGGNSIVVREMGRSSQGTLPIDGAGLWTSPACDPSSAVRDIEFQMGICLQANVLRLGSPASNCFSAPIILRLSLCAHSST
jgi:hypothetical protein